jgi:hypothetical protein
VHGDFGPAHAPRGFGRGQPLELAPRSAAAPSRRTALTIASAVA